MLFAGVMSPVDAARAPKIPKDAPFCAAPGTRPTFLSPMGEPFRAAPGQPYPSAAWIAGADRDGDGMVDRGEMARDAQRFFATLDKDRDRRLTPEEVIAYERDVAPEIALYAAGRSMGLGRTRQKLRSGESGYWGPTGAGQFAWLNVPEPVSGADADIDRIVSETEFLAAAGRRFDALDKAGAGRLRLATLPRTPQQAELVGPCWPRPSPRQQRREEERAGSR